MAGIHHQVQKHEFGSRSVAFALGFRAGGTERDTRRAAPQCAPWAAPSGKSQQREETGSCPTGLRGARAEPGLSPLAASSDPGCKCHHSTRLFPRCCRRGSEEHFVGRGLSREPRDLSGLSEVVWDHPLGGRGGCSHRR